MPSSQIGSLNRQLIEFYYRKLGPVQTVLDLGCGLGDLGQWKPNPSVKVHGIDLDPEAVWAASKFEQAQTLDLEREPLPFEAESFDAVVAKDILEHLPKPWQLLKEIRRILHPGGRLLISVPMARARVVWGDYTHIRGYTASAARCLLEDSGFHVRSIWKMGKIPLVGRLRLTAFIPVLLCLPPIDWLCGSSFELLASKLP